MCGIAGYWHYKSGRPASSGVLQHMTRSLTHRGPDEEGYWVDGSLALGMRRLRVVDLAGGRQPMANEDGSVQVVFNGEIYNHEELRLALEACGHRFRTRSDTESIVHAFEEWGPDCVERFNGMFGLAVWDARGQRLFLARDRLGIKPLYVHDGPEGVTFGSELKAVVSAPWVPLEWDAEAVDDFMTYEFVPAPRSIVAGVSKLRPGTSLLYERGRAPQIRRYWQLSADEPPPHPDEAADRLRALLQVSIRRRLMADVPLGAFLSGGIDSSIIVALMSEETPGRVRSFSMGFADRSYNELDYARTVADRFATAHREEMVTPEIVGLAGRLADLFDEPFADVSAFPTFMISEIARREVTVVLSGDGGDELFAGYDHYRAHRWAERIRWLTRQGAWRWVDALLDRLPPSSQKKGPVNKAKRFVEGLRRPADLEQARWWVFWDLVERRQLYSVEFADRLGDRDPFAYYRERLAEGAAVGFSGLQRQLYADVTGYLPDDILTKVDRMSMAVSLEARVPYLDHEFVEYCLRVPAEWKLKGDVTKWILKRAFRNELPAQIRRRGKEGFSIPMKNWLRGPLREMLSETLATERVRERGWLDPQEVARLVDEHLRGRENHGHRLWCLMSLELALAGLGRRSQASASLQEAAS
jgi:asparagine synthase (glutamine-hydrolysing)